MDAIPLRGRRSLGAALGALGCVALMAAGGEELTLQPRPGQPLDGLDAARIERFLLGEAAFSANLDPSAGLGPIFNDISCRGCHNKPATGGSSTRSVTRFGKAASGGMGFDGLDDLGGTLLQEQALSASCEESIPVEADVIVERLTPALFGIGLIEAIDDQDIVDNANNQPVGLTGIVHWVTPLEGGPARAGRFGWKGDVSTVLSFSGDAALNELGLTNALLPVENAPNGDPVLLGLCDSVADPEDAPDGLGVTAIDRFTDYQRLLAPPPQTPRSGMTGEALFEAVGCADCHLSTPYVTSVSPDPALNGISFRPYSDFLLHDMGSLGDGIVAGAATEQLMLTRPLWGLKGRLALLHDGRATGGSFRDNVIDCVAEHAGDGAASRDAFAALSAGEQDLIVAFLGSLGQVEFDFEGDNDVDGIDWFFLESQFTGPVPTFTPDDQQALADVDQDGDLDLVDFGYLQRAYTGEL